MTWFHALLVTLVAQIAFEPALAADEPAPASVDDALTGFDASADVDDVLDGFGDEDDARASATDERTSRGIDWIDRHLDLTGSGSLGASYNVTPHYALIGPNPNPPPGSLGTYYGNVQRLRARGDIQADLALPARMRARIQAFGYYDFAYLIHGRENYTEQVLQNYELQGEILDFWLAGSLGSHVDFKLGRQVVNWGRSDTLRVTDVINALNNREPGLTDIEELRLPSTMARVDAYWGRFSLTALVIPEIRYDYDPPPGNDFYPAIDVRDIPDPPPGFPLTKDQIALLLAQQAGQAFAQDPPTLRANQWGATPEFGAALTGIFSGWDLSLYYARIYQNRTSVVINLPTITQGGLFTDEDRIVMLGAGGNYTVGSWLFKAEFAWIDELDYTYLMANPAWLPTDPIPGYTVDVGQFSRIDWMGGVEYYGITDVTVALELAHRHVLGYVSDLQYLPNYVYQDNIEVALRVSTEHMNARLELTALGLVLANEAGFAGATMRLSASYELGDGMVATFGYLHFFGADQIPFNTWDANDRLFAKIKYSF